MIDTVMEALHEMNVFRPEGVDAKDMPLLCVRALRDEHRYRADGQDYVRTVMCQVDAFAKNRAEAAQLARQARDILTKAPYNYCCESQWEQYDEKNLCYQVSARYRAAMKIQEE